MVKAKFAGEGKFTVCKNMDRLKQCNHIFVVPTNNVGLECDVEHVTVNQFFRKAVSEEKLDKYNHAMFDVIVFDDLFQQYACIGKSERFRGATQGNKTYFGYL